MSAPPLKEIPKASPAGGSVHWFRRWLGTPDASVIGVIILLWIFIAVRGKGGAFWDTYNQDNLLRSIGMQSIFAIGELLVILTGGIDLSVGSLIAFDGMLMAWLMNRLVEQGVAIPTATVIGISSILIFSAFVGILHAVLIHYLRLPPFVVTLGTMSILRSAARPLNNAVPIPIQQFDSIVNMANKKVFIAGTTIGLPVPTLILIVVAVLFTAILFRTSIGRHIYAVGSNVEAARLSGINVLKVRMFVYGMCSLLAGIASILFAGYSAQGDPDAGLMFELNAISAAVIGGAVLTGGRGTVLGTILGAALLESILSTINLTLSNTHLWRGIVVGSVLLLAVILNQLRHLGRKRRQG